MPVKKISVALDENVAEQAALSARHNGVSLSGWLNAAAERAILVERGLEAVRAWEAECGELTTEELEWADSVLDAGVRHQQ